MAKPAKNLRPIIVIRREEASAAHHGGAWKVAYADFVTAMMAFFLLMWLLNATTQTQRQGLADYFAPSNIMSRSASGSGQPFGGHTPNDDGSLVSDRGQVSIVQTKLTPLTMGADGDPEQNAAAAPRTTSSAGDAATATGPVANAPDVNPAGGGQAAVAAQAATREAYLAQAASGSAARVDAAATDPAAVDEASLRAELARRERAALETVATQIRQAIRDDPALADLQQQLAIDMTPAGLRIQLLDADRVPMFANGSSAISDRAAALLRKVATLLAPLSEALAISGHTDARPYSAGGKSNWELSSERALATRRLLIEGGLREDRFHSVTGSADRDPLLPAEPLAAANRRIAIVVLRTVPPGP